MAHTASCVRAGYLFGVTAIFQLRALGYAVIILFPVFSKFSKGQARFGVGTRFTRWAAKESGRAARPGAMIAQSPDTRSSRSSLMESLRLRPASCRASCFHNTN